MLNAGNLALLAFSRSLADQQGQVLALVVMVVAACEVVVGLGLIVAAYRRKLPLNVDEFRGLRG
jgi:NADH-quinone oxidoreductase subunit K